MLVDIVAHILDQFWDEMGADGFVLAAFNGNTARAIDTSIRAYSCQSFSLEA